MKKLFLFLAIVAAAVNFSCAQQKTTLTGHIEGWGNDSLIVYRSERALYSGMGQQSAPRDTIIASGGNFEYDFPFSDTLYLQVIPVANILNLKDTMMYFPFGGSVNVLLAPGRSVAVEGAVTPEGLRYSLSGGKLEDAINKYDREAWSLYLKYDGMRYTFFKESLLMKEKMSSGTLDKQDAEMIQTLEAELRSLVPEIKAAFEKHMFENLDNDAGAYFLSSMIDDRFLSMLGGTPDKMYDAVKYIPQLSDEVRNGLFRKVLNQYSQEAVEFQAMMDMQLQKMKEDSDKELTEFITNVTTDGKVPDFTLTDIDGKPFTLSQLPQDKYIVLDFWGSWCGPCINGMPEMKEYYVRYRDKLEIVGIACNDREANWKKAVADNELSWIHVINDNSSPENNVAQRYTVKAFPTKIILAPDRSILGFYVGESAIFYEKLDEILK